jgi:hypothetical protein
MPSVSFKFCTAKVAGEGEDSDPILRVGPDLGLLGVFDGMGGAGGRVYDTPDGRHSGAYIASRFARNVVERLMLELIKPEWNLDGPATAGELHRVLASSLAARLADLNAPETTLRSDPKINGERAGGSTRRSRVQAVLMVPVRRRVGG